ncbi:hypothetical protein GOM96_18295 [Stutzerimonas degradans]|nr:hypothetical protein GOM96_18295 [Stutzerimonas degradans]
MKYFASLREKIDLVHHQFSELIGKAILGYELAQTGVRNRRLERVE